MRLLDINILIYAHRADQQDHLFYKTKLEALCDSQEPYGLTPSVASGFVRVITLPNYPNGPTPLHTALAFIETVMAPPQAGWVRPGRSNWEIFSGLCRKTGCTGNLSADAQHAATAIEHAAVWVSRDSDFYEFSKHGLRFEHWSPAD